MGFPTRISKLQKPFCLLWLPRYATCTSQLRVTFTYAIQTLGLSKLNDYSPFLLSSTSDIPGRPRSSIVQSGGVENSF
jgi:hypothetical protein